MSSNYKTNPWGNKFNHKGSNNLNTMNLTRMTLRSSWNRQNKLFVNLSCKKIT